MILSCLKMSCARRAAEAYSCSGALHKSRCHVHKCQKLAGPCLTLTVRPAEPNTEQLRGTREGAASDHHYNAGVVLATVRYAMVDALRSPRPGFEDVVRAHFRLLRHRIMGQCSKWLAAFKGEGEAYMAGLSKAVGELHSLLQALVN